MLKKYRFVFVGPESTGKSTLAKLCAEKLDGFYVPEYARQYLEQTEGKYDLADVLEMNRKQYLLEKEASQNNHHLFVDTDVYVFKVWLKEAFDYELDVKDFQNPFASHYFLCSIDVPWEADDLREHPLPEDRARLFGEYRALLESNGEKFTILEGNVKARFAAVQEQIKKIID